MSDLTSAVASTLFLGRNVEKKVKEKRLKEPVIICQAWNAANYLAKIGDIDSKVVKGTKGAIDAFRLAGESNKFIKSTCKVLDFSGGYVNGVIGGCGFLEAVSKKNKDEQLSTGLKNAASIGLMLLFEKKVLKPYLRNFMEYISKIKGVDKIVEKIMKSASKYKYGDKLTDVTESILFVTGSGLASAVGEKFGSMVARQVQPVKGKEKKAA